MRLVAIACLIGGCSFDPAVKPSETEPGATDDAGPAEDGGEPDAVPAADFKLRVEVLVDGWSYLKVKGTTLQWEHHVYAAPGRWQGATLPTRVNGTDWFPMWPDLPTAENRDCGGCKSSTTELPVGVPRVPSTTTIREVQVRRAQELIQAPAADNDYELIVRITDYGQGGGANYVVEIDVIPDPAE